MKYSLRSLMIAAILAPPLLAWGALPIYRWLTMPKPLKITKPYTVAPPHIGYPSPGWWEEIMAEERSPYSSESAPNPPKK